LTQISQRNFGRNATGGKYRNAKKDYGGNLSTYYNQQNKAESLHANEELFEDLMDTNRKMSDVEKWYAMDADQGETKHITKYIVKNSLDVKTLDVKILELRESPDNIQLLLDVISLIYDQSDTLADAGSPIKDFDLVNYVLAAALKADKIDAHDLGMIIAYLESVSAPSIYF
jgi:hypothetical protein